MENVKIRRLVRWLLVDAVILTILGLIFVYSASSVLALERHGNAFYFFIRQLWHIPLAAGGFLIAALVPLRIWKESAVIIFAVAWGIMLLPAVLGFVRVVHGSGRWFEIAGVALGQPSELFAIACIICIARLACNLSLRGMPLFSRHMVPFFIVLVLSAGVLLIQPDFGAAVNVTLTGILMLLSIAVSFQQAIILGAAAIPIVGIIICLAPYRLKRILTFLDPWADPRGKGFQIIQSLIAISSGGWWGVGIGNSRQKFFYLPMQHTDFIFSIIAEETGFIGSIILMGLFMLFMFLGAGIARGLSERFGGLVVIGCVGLISLRALMNFMVCTGLIPTKGVALPLISYGGSALVATWIMIGLIVAAVRAERFS